MKSLKHLNKYFLRYKWRLLLGICFTIVSNYFGVKMPMYFKEAIDSLNIVEVKPNISDALWLSFYLGGIYILLSALKGFFLFLMRQTIIVMSRLIEYDMKNDIYAHYQKLDASFYKRTRIGDLMNRISEDVGQVRMYLGPGVMYSINLVLLSIMSIYQMAQINGTLTLLALIPLPFMSLIIYKVSNKINSISKEVQGEQSNISSIAQENFSGIRVIKAYNQVFPSILKFNKASEGYRQNNMKLVMINALFMPTIFFLIGTSTLTVIYFGGLMTQTKAMSLGGIVAFIFYVYNLTWPFVSIGWVTSIIQRAEASQSRIMEFLDEKPEIENPSNAPIEYRGKIEFKNVSFVYPNTGITALNRVSLTINKGETIGILGKTGSGKSTLLSLLLRQLDPTEGEITVDNQRLKEINIDAYRGQTSYVPQDIFLFSDTIRNNVSFGSLEQEVTDSRVKDALIQAHVWHNIEAFPDQLNTVLGELGVNLSGGQKQRISIARALIRKPRLLLMDDCLSAVDTETEEIILKNIKQNSETLGTIMVSHRISSLRNANRILVLNEGQVAEEGTHDELMLKQGIYYQTYELQMQQNEPL